MCLASYQPNFDTFKFPIYAPFSPFQFTCSVYDFGADVVSFHLRQNENVFLIMLLRNAINPLISEIRPLISHHTALIKFHHQNSRHSSLITLILSVITLLDWFYCYEPIIFPIGILI
jgi:hypothetical protein